MGVPGFFIGAQYFGGLMEDQRIIPHEQECERNHPLTSDWPYFPRASNHLMVVYSDGGCVTQRPSDQRGGV